ncbi:uncharacterized protein LOC133638923 isoform X2 [Entelurus aequoreus]|uniref:uncharacterized protein LOC133638923 isoform X2 n=1 Tax=Entelurus aequoreus TaxID=161455 RepID=UPI002B1E159F|nr:uncharacterized protein LOC133638923 isoform X2 [Entelurus aequoreus]
MDKFITPVLSRGRGILCSESTNSREVGRSSITADGCTNKGLGRGLLFTPVDESMRETPHTSTPNSDVDAIHHLTDMVGQLGAQIGESIVEKLMFIHNTAGVVNMQSDCQSSPAVQNTHNGVSKHDLQHLTVQVKSDKDLQTFRGDNTDRYSVQDWIVMTKTFLKRHNVIVDDQTEEILNHLMGKARDVVQIALRSDPGLNVRQRPELIYNILLQYFSDAPSCLPLADFYATLPKHRENPVDYWIRLNKAADLALEGLHRQGKRAENMYDEVALMFVKHCPDPELSCILKCKPLHEWTSRDVQQRIDDYQGESRANRRAAGTAQLKSHITAVASEQAGPPSVSLPVSEECRAPVPSPLFPQAQRHVYCSPLTPPMSASVPNEHQRSPSLTPATAVVQNLQQTEERLLTRMVDMFQMMMDKMQRGDTDHQSQGGRFQRATRGRRPREAACRICDDPRHTTISHCMSDRLCFTCFAPGHTKLNCTANNSPSPSLRETS